MTVYFFYLAVLRLKKNDDSDDFKHDAGFFDKTVKEMSGERPLRVFLDALFERIGKSVEEDPCLSVLFPAAFPMF